MHIFSPNIEPFYMSFVVMIVVIVIGSSDVVNDIIDNK